MTKKIAYLNSWAQVTYTYVPDLTRDKPEPFLDVVVHRLSACDVKLDMEKELVNDDRGYSIENEPYMSGRINWKGEAEFTFHEPLKINMHNLGVESHARLLERIETQARLLFSQDEAFIKSHSTPLQAYITSNLTPQA